MDSSGDVISASADNSQTLALMPLHQQDKFMQLATLRQQTSST
jgi:hypothetical protein